MTRNIIVLFAFICFSGCLIKAQDIFETINNGNFEDVKTLLEKNPGLLELKGINGRTPIFLAVTGDHVEIVELLINKGANLNALDKSKRNCLHLACYGRNEKIIQMLIKGGIDINAMDEMGHKPYDFAVSTNNDNIIAMLKSSGGTPTEIKDPEVFKLGRNFVSNIV